MIATSAIPLIFPNSNIGSVSYSDGGIPKIGDNSPIFPIYLRGCDEFFVVHNRKGIKTDKNKYKRSKIIDISPSKDLGGMLRFNGDVSKKLIELGYKDAKTLLSK